MEKSSSIKSLTKNEQTLLGARNPKEYVDISLKLKIPSGRKAFITRLWLEKKGFTSKDIDYYRNRHPYWKKKKLEGSAERTAKRFEEHNYVGKQSIVWDEGMVEKFIDMNKKDKAGKYIHKDWELAKHFKCSIATVQHMRRKYNMAEKYIVKKLGKITGKRLVEMLLLGEGTLRAMVRKK